MDGSLPSDQAARVESHLADCAACLEQVVFLMRRPADAPPGVVPPDLLARAQSLVVDTRRSFLVPTLRWATLAAAACLVLLVGLQHRREGAPLPGPTVTTSAPAATAPAPVPAPVPQTAPRSSPIGSPPPPVAPSAPVPSRRATTATDALVLLSPTEGSALTAGKMSFEWRPVTGALFYEVSVLTDDGTVAWQGTTEATSVRIPAADRLAPAKYYVSVRAYLASGRTVRSAAVSFNVGGS